MTTAPRGHVKLARKAFDAEHGDPFWLEPRTFSKWEAWVDLIQRAAFRQRRYVTKYGPIDLARGELVAAIRPLAQRWKWPTSTVHHYLKGLEKVGRIVGRSTGRYGTVYLIANYNTYQGTAEADGTADCTVSETMVGRSLDKKEAVKQLKQEPFVRSPDVEVVIGHYLALHPHRRPSQADAKLVARRLETYTAAELCEALDGNAEDEWHRERRKHELSYVLRDNGKVDDFRAKAQETAPRLAVDPATGLPNEIGLRILSGGRAA